MEIVQHRVINTIGVPWKFNEVVNAEGLQYNYLKRRILWNFNSGEYENKGWEYEKKGWKKIRLIRRSHKSLELVKCIEVCSMEIYGKGGHPRLVVLQDDP